MGILNLIARVKMEGAGKVITELRETKEGSEKAAKGMEHLGRSMGKAEGAARSFGNMAMKALGASALLGTGALAYAVQYDSLGRALASVSENASDLTGKLGRLQQIAKLPGLSFAQAAQGVVTLQSAGLSANLAERAVAAFGNALASVGKGSGELEGVITALSQIQSKGIVSAEEIGQLAERLPMIRKLLQGAFGTSNTEQIQRMGVTASDAIARIVAEAEKLPRVSGGIGNALENLADVAGRTLLPLGQGLAAGINAALPTLERYLGAVEVKLRGIGEYIAALGNSGVLFEALNKFGKGLGELFGMAKVNLEGFSAGLISFVSNLPGDIAKILKYTGAVLSVVISNIGTAFSYAAGLVDSIGKRIEGIAARIQNTFRGLIETAQNMARLDLRGAARSLTATLAAGLAVSPSLAVSAPQFQPFPAVPNLKGITDGARYEALINAAKRPLSMLPDNLTFGGAEKPLSVSLASLKPEEGSGQSWGDRMLAAIEHNTRNTADILSLRKQGIGGGDLARIGVTATELRHAGGRGYAPMREDYGTRPVASELEAVVRRLSRGEAQRLLRSGRRFATV